MQIKGKKKKDKAYCFAKLSGPDFYFQPISYTTTWNPCFIWNQANISCQIFHIAFPKGLKVDMMDPFLCP